MKQGALDRIVTNMEFKKALKSEYDLLRSWGGNEDESYLESRYEKLKPILESAASELEGRVQSLVSMPKEERAKALCEVISDSRTILEEKYKPGLKDDEQTVLHLALQSAIGAYAILSFAMSDLGLDKKSIDKIRPAYQEAEEVYAKIPIATLEQIEMPKEESASLIKEGEELLKSGELRTLTQIKKVAWSYIEECRDLSSQYGDRVCIDICEAVVDPVWVMQRTYAIESNLSQRIDSFKQNIAEYESSRKG